MGARLANPPRRNAKQDRAHQTIEAIVGAAAQVLIERGYEAATTNRIAERAGVSVGSLYQYFANKDEVFQRLLDRQLARVVDAFDSYQADSRRPLRETLADLLLLSLDVHEYGPGLSRMLAQAPNNLLRSYVDRARTPIIDRLAETLRMYESDLAVSDIDAAARLIVAASEGVGFYAAADGSDADLPNELARMFAGYLLSEAQPRTKRRHQG